MIGTGAVGGTIAALLARAGHEVSVTARGAQLDAIRSSGLQLSGAWGEFTAHVIAGEVLTGSPELAFVTTKAQDAAAAMRANADVLAGIPVVIVQNGLGAFPTAKRSLPRSDAIVGLALYATSFLSPGMVTVTTAGPTYLGGPVIARLYASRILGAVMPVRVTDNLEGAQWTKLIVNHINALPAITGLSAQEVISDARLRRIMTESMREAVRVARAKDIRFERLQGLSDRMLRLLVMLPVSLGQGLPLLMRARLGPTPNPGSTLQSIRRGQLTEIDFLNGAVSSAGAEVGVPTPIETALVEMVHEVERSGEFLTPEAVVARVS